MKQQAECFFEKVHEMPLTGLKPPITLRIKSELLIEAVERCLSSPQPTPSHPQHPDPASCSSLGACDFATPQPFPHTDLPHHITFSLSITFLQSLS